jgi:hypothetical protein
MPFSVTSTTPSRIATLIESFPFWIIDPIAVPIAEPIAAPMPVAPK